MKIIVLVMGLMEPATAKDCIESLDVEQVTGCYTDQSKLDYFFLQINKVKMGGNPKLESLQVRLQGESLSQS